MTTSASVLNFWTADMEGFTEGFVYVALPITLMAINSVKVEVRLCILSCSIGSQANGTRYMVGSKSLLVLSS